MLLPRAVKPPQKWLKTMTQLTRRQQPRVSLLQELHFTQRCKQTCPPSCSSVHLASGHNNEPGPCTWHSRLCLSVLRQEITLQAEREENTGTTRMRGRGQPGHRERGKQRHEKHTATNMTKTARNSKNKLAQKFSLCRF